MSVFQDSVPTRNTNIVVTPARRPAKPLGTPPSSGSRSWQTPVDIEKLEREHKNLLVRINIDLESFLMQFRGKWRCLEPWYCIKKAQCPEGLGAVV
jgi:hypothetical protein